jgi:hypothetical protein
MEYERRGMFFGLKVPFEPNMLILALACVAGFHWIIEFLELFMDVDDLLLRMVHAIGGPKLYPGLPAPLNAANWVLPGAVTLAFWGFFSTAINRIAALKIAREETLSVIDAAKFSASRFLATIGTAVFVGAIFLALYLVGNATVFGWIGRMPYVGELVVALLYPVVLLFTFLLVVSLVLGIFGFNLASSAIATECGDTWEGVSRSWNYVIVRPWTVIMTLGLTAAFITVFAFAGHQFMAWSLDSLTIGTYGMGEGTAILSIEGRDLDPELRNQIYAARLGVDPERLQASEEDAKAYNERIKAFETKSFWIAVPRKVDFLRSYSGGRFEWDTVPYAAHSNDPTVAAFIEKHKSSDERIENFAGRVANVESLVPATLKLSAVVINLFRWLCIYLMAAYALQYFFGANTLLYFLLRWDVEGEETTEIMVEDEELDDDSVWGRAQPVASVGAPGQLILPAKSVGGPVAELPTKPTDKSPAPGGAGETEDATKKDASEG